tara:strand:+ start:267 stop:389 length:123 start_codon:yes stop_codon:yes gene_type:complete
VTVEKNSATGSGSSPKSDAGFGSGDDALDVADDEELFTED